MIILMNHLRNTIKRYINSDNVRITAMALGSAGFCAGGLVGMANGMYTVLSDAIYSRHECHTTRKNIGNSVYAVTNIIGQPIVGAIAGTAIALTAPVSIPALYYFYQKAEKEEHEERMRMLTAILKDD